MLRVVGAEICRLEQYREQREPIESEKRKVEMLRQRVPDSPGLDRLLRYASSLERAFDRVLAQFDRARRIRKEQLSAPEGGRKEVLIPSARNQSAFSPLQTVVLLRDGAHYALPPISEDFGARHVRLAADAITEANLHPETSPRAKRQKRKSAKTNSSKP